MVPHSRIELAQRNETLSSIKNFLDNLKPEFDDWSYERQWQDPGEQYLGFAPHEQVKKDFQYELEVLESMPDIEDPVPELSNEVKDLENKQVLDSYFLEPEVNPFEDTHPKVVLDADEIFPDLPPLDP